MQNETVLTMRNIDKIFPGTRALNNVDFTLRRGEVHALMGENGAGKSTLIKVLTGVYEKDGGTIRVEGTEAHIHSPQDAQNVGISTVYQEITLCPNLTVAENMFIGRTKGTLIPWKNWEKRATEILTNLGIPARAKQELSTCSLAVQQMVAIARAVDMNCKVLILDEPTSSLDDKEVQMLFDLMRDLKNKGVGIIFVTHFLDQVYEVSDRITVLRNGQLVGEYEISKLPREELVAKMMGKDLNDLADMEKFEAKAKPGDEMTYEAKGLSSSESKPFDFHIRKGEVNGFTGLLGSGRSESVRAIFGADRVTGGTVTVGGKTVKITKPYDAMKHGIGYLPEDRKRDGIIADLSVRDNIILALQAMRGFFKPMSRSEMDQFADEYVKALNIKTASKDTPIGSLSGGNQQKVIIAREVTNDKDLLIAVNPTRGLDVGAIEYVHRYIVDQRNKGKAILLVSFELDEVMSLSDRIDVIFEGKIVGSMAGKDAHEHELSLLMTGGAGK